MLPWFGEIIRLRLLLRKLFKQALTKFNRQSLLERILAEQAKEIREWKEFERLVYDPDFRQYTADTGKLPETEFDSNYGKYNAGEKVIPLSCTEISAVGKKPRCYISERAFEIARTEDEIKSMLDHESIHAAYTSGRVPINYNIKDLDITKEKATEAIKKASKEISGMAHETLAFDAQLFYIVNGRRKVSQEFMNRLGPAVLLRQELQKISERQDNEGLYARIILNTLHVKMTDNQPK